ncbi:MAG: nucleotidyl transferase AbiEii/AbiGii toxin family protein [Verrucomicrobiota bacterium]
MNRQEHYDIATWASEAPGAEQREFRQAVHTILAAIANDPRLNSTMVIKGGILLGVRYHSLRFTKDIDFSTTENLSSMSAEDVRTSFESSLVQVIEELEYDLDCKVQSCKVNPQNRPDASFPSIELKIGHAYKGSPKHKRLQKLQSPSVVSIDFSLNEKILGVESLKLGSSGTINAYTFADLVAEKFRSLLQQESRDRYRRQDVFDLSKLSELEASEDERRSILKSLIEKSRARGIEPLCDSLDNTELKRRAQADYHTLDDEIDGPLPEFEATYEIVRLFYQSLPWPEDMD